MHPKDAAPIDLDSVLERLDGDRAFLYEMIEEFIAFASEQVNELHTAVEEHNVEKVEHISHSIKGAASNLSIEPMRASALRLEEMARGGNLDGAEDLIAWLENELMRLRDFAATKLE